MIPRPPGATARWARRQCVLALVLVLVFGVLCPFALVMAQHEPFSRIEAGGAGDARAPRPSAALDLTPAERAFLASLTRLRVGVDRDWFPFDALDATGQHVGIAADYMALLSARLGIPFAVVALPSWQQTLDALQRRELDILAMAARTPERSVYAEFTTPYVRSPMVIVTRQDVPFLRDARALRGERVAAVPGYASHEYLRNHYPDLPLVDVENTIQGLRDVASGRVFALVDNLAAASHFMMREGLANLKVSGQLTQSFDLAIGVRNDWPLLHGILDKALRSLSDEEHSAIYNRWIHIEFITRPDYSRIVPIIAGLMLAVGLISLYTWRLHVLRDSLQLANTRLRAAEERLLSQNAELERLSNTDRLTGVYNRRKLDQILNEHSMLAERYGHPLSAVLLDLDRFKTVNDRHGHAVGDEILRVFGELVRCDIRKTDAFGRWGGEEFLLICPGTSLDEASELAVRILSRLRDHRFPREIRQTVSAGASDYQAGEGVAAFLERCDRLLYQAKQAGRDRLMTASGDLCGVSDTGSAN